MKNLEEKNLEEKNPEEKSRDEIQRKNPSGPAPIPTGMIQLHDWDAGGEFGKSWRGWNAGGCWRDGAGSKLIPVLISLG